MSGERDTVRQGRLRLLQFSFWFLIFALVVLIGWWNLLRPEGTLIVTLLLAGAGLAWLAALRPSRFTMPATPLDHSLLLLVGVILFTSWMALDPSRSWRMAWQWLACAFFFYVVVTLLRGGWSGPTMLSGLLLVLGISAVGAYYQLFRFLVSWYGAGPWPNLFPPGLPRLSGLSGGPNLLAIQLNLGIFAAVALWARTSSTRGRLLLVAWIFLALPLVLLAASRSAWLGLLAGVALLLLARPATRQRRVRDLTLVGGGGLLLLLLLYFVRPETFDVAREIAIGFRTRFWVVAFEGWQTSPISGSGLGSYGTHFLARNEVPFGTIFNAAHNLFFQALSDMGLLGFVAVTWIAVGVGWHGWRRRTSLDGWSRGLAAALVAFLVHALLDTPETWILFPAVALTGAFTAAQPGPRLPRWQSAVWGAVWIGLLIGGGLGYRRAALYQQAVDAAAVGDDAVAVEYLERAQALLPYDDSAALQAQALIQSRLALGDPLWLDGAIAAQERLVAREPGYSLHHANLAALYAARGAEARAAEVMDVAIERAPASPMFRLNALLWADVSADATAPEPLVSLHRLSRTWTGAPFWAAWPALAPSPSPPVGYAWPAGADPAEMVDRLEAEVAREPYNWQTYLGLGMAWLRVGDAEGAQEAFVRADRVMGAGDQLGLSSIYRRTAIRLWYGLVPEVEPAILEDIQTQLHFHSAFGPAIGTGTYTMEFFDRLALPTDIVPQMRCFTVTEVWAAELAQVREWYVESGREEDALWIQRLLDGDGDGTVSCSGGER